MNWPFIRRVLLYGILYYLVILLLHGLIFLLSHFPPSVVKLDWLILRLGELQSVLAWPRPLLRRLWPGESSPAALNYTLIVLNCLLWGLALAGFKTWRARSKK